MSESGIDEEAWAEIEQMMTEEVPQLMEGFDRAYQPPKYRATTIGDECSRCGATVTLSGKAIHNKWHRALSLRVHTQMALTSLLFSLVNPGEKP